MDFFLGEDFSRIIWLLDWLLSNYVEIIATISGLIYLLYSVQGNKLLWPYGMLTSAFYVVVFLNSGIYADMAINIYYLGVSIYGWFYWSKQGNSGSGCVVSITTLSKQTTIVLFISTLLLFVFIGFILVKFTNSDIAYWDAFTTAASIVATWMLARKIMEHWLVWIVVDAISVGLYLYKELYPTVLLFTVYTVMAIFGYFEWKKKWRKEFPSLSL